MERIGSGLIIDTSNHTYYDDSQFHNSHEIPYNITSSIYSWTHGIPPHADNVQNNKKMCKIEFYVNDKEHVFAVRVWEISWFSQFYFFKRVNVILGWAIYKKVLIELGRVPGVAGWWNRPWVWLIIFNLNFIMFINYLYS